MPRMFNKPAINPVEDTAARSAFRRIIDWIEDTEPWLKSNFDVSAPGGQPSVIQPIGPGAFDHGALSGLLDDDHPQYLRRNETHDHTLHTDRTRTIWLPPHLWTQVNGTTMSLGQTGTFPNKYLRWSFNAAPASKPQALGALLKIPTDFVSNAVLAMAYTTPNTVASDGKIRFRCRYYPLNDAVDDDIANQESVFASASTIQVSSTDLNLSTLGTPRALQSATHVGRLTLGTLASVAAGDHLRLVLDRDVDHSDDTFGDGIDFLGAYLAYTADM